MHSWSLFRNQKVSQMFLLLLLWNIILLYHSNSHRSETCTLVYMAAYMNNWTGSFASIFTTLGNFNDSMRSRGIQAQDWLVEGSFWLGRPSIVRYWSPELLKHSFNPFGRCSWRAQCGGRVMLLWEEAFHLPYFLSGRVPILKWELGMDLCLSTFCKRKPQGAKFQEVDLRFPVAFWFLRCRGFWSIRPQDLHFQERDTLTSSAS